MVSECNCDEIRINVHVDFKQNMAFYLFHCSDNLICAVVTEICDLSSKLRLLNYERINEYFG